MNTHRKSTLLKIHTCEEINFRVSNKQGQQRFLCYVLFRILIYLKVSSTNINHDLLPNPFFSLTLKTPPPTSLSLCCHYLFVGFFSCFLTQLFLNIFGVKSQTIHVNHHEQQSQRFRTLPLFIMDHNKSNDLLLSLHLPLLPLLHPWIPHTFIQLSTKKPFPYSFNSLIQHNSSPRRVIDTMETW